MKDLAVNKAVIFDLDGTIWNSIPYRIKAWQNAFRDYGMESDPEVIRLMIGYPGSMLIKKMNAKDPEIEQREEKYFGDMLTDVKFYPDVEQTFHELKELNFKIAIVTSSRRKLIEKLNIKADAIVTIDDVNKGKPDPEPYKKAMELMNSAPETTIVVGDIDNDLIPANTLGSVAVLVKHGLPKKSEHKDYEINEIHELIGLIKKLNF